MFVCRGTRYAIVLVLLVSLLATSCAFAAGPNKLNVGDKAPTLSVAKWVKGTPVKGFAKNKIYVVEFWATWCGPCKQTIPHLTELAKKLKDKVTFIGVDVWDNDKDAASTAYFDKVDKFVQDMGDKMDYNVAIDGPEKTMATTWMEDANQKGIPAAFIVGKDGRIAWIGHPMDNMSEILDQVLAGKWDVKAEAKRQAELAEAERKKQELFKPFVEARRSSDYAKMVSEADKLIAANAEYEREVFYGKYAGLLHTDENAAYAYAKRLSEGDYKDNYGAQYSMANAMLDMAKDLKNPDYALALAMASRANELTNKVHPVLWFVLSKAQFGAGQKDAAIESCNKAIEIAEKQKDPPMQESLINQFKEALSTYSK